MAANDNTVYLVQNRDGTILRVFLCKDLAQDYLKYRKFHTGQAVFLVEHEVTHGRPWVAEVLR